MNKRFVRKIRHRLLFLTKPFYDFLDFINPLSKAFLKEFEEKFLLLNNTIQASGGGQTFLFFTDFHERYNAKASSYIIKRIVSAFLDVKVFFGGDVITLSEKTKNLAKTSLNNFLEEFSFLKSNFYLIYGNHDNNSHQQKTSEAILKPDEIRRFISNGKKIEFFNDFSYFVDDEKFNTRFLCLDTGKQSLLQEEIQEIKKVLETCAKGFHIIVFTHIVYEFIEKSYQSRKYIKELLDLFDTHNKEGQHGKIECIVAGHIHNDFFGHTDGGIPIFIADSDAYLFSSNRFVRKRRHLSQQCVTAFVLDYEKRRMNAIRFGYGIDSIDGYKVCIIDDTPTVIDIIRGNIAKGFILNTDLTLRPTYIAKCGNYFAHGETKEKAISDAKRKYEDNLPVSERLRMFNEAYPDRDRKIPASELFEWHSRLTGSCEQGRIMFCKDRGLDWRNGEYTVNEFIEITKDAYGGEVIRQLDKTKPNG